MKRMIDPEGKRMMLAFRQPSFNLNLFRRTFTLCLSLMSHAVRIVDRWRSPAQWRAERSNQTRPNAPRIPFASDIVSISRLLTR